MARGKQPEVSQKETIRGRAGTEGTCREDLGAGKRQVRARKPLLRICLSRPSDPAGKMTRSLPFMFPYSCTDAFNVSALSVCLSHQVIRFLRSGTLYDTVLKPQCTRLPCRLDKFSFPPLSSPF